MSKYDLKLRPTEQYIVLDNLDFSWYPHELDEAIKAWDGGMHIADIAMAFDRRTEEVFLLLMDLTLHGKITERDGGIFGRGING